MPGRYVEKLWTPEPGSHAPARYRRGCRYEAFVPDTLADLPLTLEGSVAGVVSEAEAAIRELNEAAVPALVPLARLLLRTESIASSKIEGLQAGVRELARAEAGVEAAGRARPHTAEVLANIAAMGAALKEATRAQPLTTAGIVSIHRRLMERAHDAPRIAGQIRKTQNWIGGNDYNPCGADVVPPPPDEVHRLLDDLCSAVNDDRLPPIVQAALVHAQFETIHPFADGNGRVGRALVHVVLKRRGVARAYVPPVSVVLAAHRDRYIHGLTRFRGDKVGEWVEHFAAAARRSAKLAEAYVGEVQALVAKWRTKLERLPAVPRSDAAAWAVIAILPGYPVITAPTAAAAADRSKPQIYEAIEQLETAGVLKPLSKSKRNRSWEAAGLLDLMEQLESGALPQGK